jgi:hypothetical protein
LDPIGANLALNNLAAALNLTLHQQQQQQQQSSNNSRGLDLNQQFGSLAAAVAQSLQQQQQQQQQQQSNRTRTGPSTNNPFDSNTQESWNYSHRPIQMNILPGNNSNDYMDSNNNDLNVSNQINHLLSHHLGGDKHGMAKTMPSFPVNPQPAPPFLNNKQIAAAVGFFSSNVAGANHHHHHHKLASVSSSNLSQQKMFSDFYNAAQYCSQSSMGKPAFLIYFIF